MHLLGLRTLIYPTSNIDEDKKWWTDALGFAPYFDQPFYVGFNVGGYELGLDPNAKVSNGPRTYYGVSDINKAIQHFKTKGCTIAEAPSEPGGGIIVCSLTMPNKQLLHLIYNPYIKPGQVLEHVD